MLKMVFLNARGIKGRAGPLLQSTMRLCRPMLILLKCKPDRASSLSLLKSGSSGCWTAISFQSIPMSVMELMTQSRSSLAAWARAAALGFADEGVEDAVLEDSGFWTQGGIVDVPDWAGGVVPTWSTRRLRSEAPGGLDEGVEDEVVEG